MSSLTASSNIAAAGITGGYGLYNQLQRYVSGDESRVHFISGSITQVQFDACISETHVYQAAPSQFPIEDGSTISDHIAIGPIELQIVGAVSDSPVQSEDTLIDSGFGTAIGYAAKPLGALGSLASTAGFTSLKAYATGNADGGNKPKISRSAQVYQTLRRLAGYTQVEDASGEQARSTPEVFDVVTAKQGKKFCTFSDMCITNLQLQRDQSTGSRSLMFAISLTEIRRAFSTSIIVRTAQPDKSNPKAHAGGEGQGIADELEKRFQADPDGRASFLKKATDYWTPTK